MATDRTDHLERDLARTHLLITRGDLAGARAMLPQLARDGASQQDVQPLLDAIALHEAQASQQQESRRGLRYQLGLQSTSRRIGWFIAAIAATGFGVLRTIEAAAKCSALGFATVISTHVSRHSPYDLRKPPFVLR